MEPTVHSGELLDFDSGAYDDADPELGDIVSLWPPEGYEFELCGARRGHRSPCARPEGGPVDDQGLLKRVVAGPGDRVAIAADGGVILNGRKQYEPFILPCPAQVFCSLPDPITVPEGHWFVMGDNRGYSSDSRFWGPVQLDWIEGRATPPR